MKGGSFYLQNKIYYAKEFLMEKYPKELNKSKFNPDSSGAGPTKASSDKKGEEGQKKKCCKGMPKLYYTPTSCGFASFASAHICGLKLECEQVDLKTHKTDGGVDFYTINSKGNVPCLVFPCGTVLNENVAILNWIADQNISAGLAPQNGSFCRYKLSNILSWINSEFHPGVGIQFSGGSDEVKAVKKANAQKKLAYFEDQVLEKGKKKFCCGECMTIADIYAAVVISWTAYVGPDLKDYPNTDKFMKAIYADERIVAAKKLADSKPKTL